MRRRQRQRTASERQAIGEQMRAQRLQEWIGASHGAGLVETTS